MRLKFTKMQGLGNDFVVLDATGGSLSLAPGQLRRLADRHFGIGCDQILQIEAPRQADTDFYYRIFNADGAEVEQCGNGARCFVRYVHEHGLTGKREIRVGTLGGLIVPRLEGDGQVTVNMGVPEFDPSRIPFQAPARARAGAANGILGGSNSGTPMLTVTRPSPSRRGTITPPRVPTRISCLDVSPCSRT